MWFDMKKYLIIGFAFLISSCSLIQFGGYNPPTKDELLSNSAYKWQKDSTDNFNYYYDPITMSQEYVDSAKIYFERNYPKLLKFLGIKEYRNKLNLFMVESRPKMKNIIGMETNGIANAKDNTVYSLFNANVKTYGMHEFCHVISINEWGGMYKEIWLSEGLAVNSDNIWWGFELHALANYLQHKGKLIPLAELVEKFHDYNNFISYPECGSIVKYLNEKYGIELIRELWKNGSIVFENKLHKSIKSIEEEWLQEINKHDYTAINYGEKIFALYGEKL
ncbi:MAG: hypothetical protein AUK34_07035 [Ignavibacteria bacterium CG2_30_36_16]|nr:MAG: hypothetical protein AUK34_07035 [Ignavibacteria bacterium CG2_30_36_16]